mmetsp:Transcript_112903/g.319405  ORF Transcript_112903/g.319405 Transcript_112903/m.319405 type:complete len:269 (-) Transcript_112903:136-942(-)
MRRFVADVEHGHAGEIELEPMNAKGAARPQLLALAEADVRNGFARKVYGILTGQLITTTLLGGLMVCYGRQWLRSSPSTMLTAVTFSCVMSLVLVGVFSCCPDVMRRSPGNYGFLALLTVAESILVGFACLQYTLGSVLMCVGITAFVVLGLSIYATRTKTDLTSFGPYLMCGLLVLCGTGFMLMLAASLGLTHNPLFNAVQVLYAAGGALVFSFFIVYDTQMIMGGSHQHEFSVDDYAMAAICLYLDIIQLFLSLLRLLGQKDDTGI